MSEQPIGFLVWCPEAGLPTVAHETYERACAEALRLGRAHPSKRFVVMSPVEGVDAAMAAQAWSDGRRLGYVQGKRDVRADQAVAVNCRFAPIERSAAAFQASVADCLLWFNGFRAAWAMQEPYERPSTPDLTDLRELNGALQELARTAPRAADLDDEIPF